MTFAWLILLGFAVGYTYVVFWLPISDDFPPILSSRNSTSRSRILLVHTIFLCALLCTLWYLTARENSFTWLTRGPVPSHPAALYVFFVAVFAAMLERLLLSGKEVPGPSDHQK